MRKYKGLFTTSIILIIIGLLGIMLLSLFAGVFNQRSLRGFRGGMRNDMDRHFIEAMIPHHEDAVAMAKLALTKAEHEEIRLLAENIIDNQTREINDMRSWYQSWYGTDVPEFNIGGMGMMQDMTDMASLTSAEPFDKEFIEQMIPHHQMAVMMASMLLNRTDQKEMKQLAQNIIKTQTEEMNQMAAWHKEWY
jgi:uncharacterized protein (DUF305 family)